MNVQSVEAQQGSAAKVVVLNENSEDSLYVHLMFETFLNT